MAKGKAKGGSRGGGPPPAGKQVEVHHDVLLSRLKAMNESGDAKAVLAFGEQQPKIMRSSPALMSAVADAASALKQFDRAEALRRDILKIEPGHSSTTNNLIVLLIRRDAYAEAETLARELVARDPNHAEARHNLSLILYNTGRRAEAEAEAKAVIAIKPDHMIANFMLAHALLSQGKFAEGWPQLEWRTASANTQGNIAPPLVSFPQWRGESLDGKSILIWMEQGLGDEIMMSRYAVELKIRGAALVSMICRPVLEGLFKNLPGVDVLYAAVGDVTVPRHDYWTYPMSMPLGCGTRLDSIPSRFPYLGPSAAARTLARDLRGPSEAVLWVGLCWKGGVILVNDHNRSIPSLATLAPLWDVTGVSYFALQKGQAEDEAANPPADQPLIDLGPRLADFDATAAFIERMDVVVTVDTAVAHLAGAMGKPCLVLLPALAQDWRWMDKTYSPWYPSLALFRQTTPGDWGPAVAQVAADLNRRVAAASRTGVY